MKIAISLILLTTLLLANSIKEYSKAGIAYAQTNSKSNYNRYKNIIKQIVSKNKKAPSGLYAEYAYMLYQDGDIDEARVFFDKEIQAYPKSKKFINHIIDRLYR
jgi:hypothetical protein